mgnify:CR=1 FL=1|jgi:hypothetical protein
MKKTHTTPPGDPWSEFDSKRRTYAFGLRLTERETAKIKSLAEQKGTSMHKLCVDALATYLGESDHAANTETMECPEDKNHKVLCPHCKGTLFEIAR